MDDTSLASASTTPIVDVFGSVESPTTPKGHPAHHFREQPIVDGEAPLPPLFNAATQLARTAPSRSGSRRTQSVDVSPRAAPVPRQLAAPSPLGPARRKRGERDAGHERKREKDTIRAELDASAASAPGLVLDPRIASDVLALERRFAAASKGKASASPHSRPPRTHGHRPRHSLPANRSDLLPSPNASHRASLVEPLASLPESGTSMIESDFSGGAASGSAPAPSTTLVGPALPTSGVQNPASSMAPSAPTPSTTPPKLGPSPIRIDKSAYSSLLPSSDQEHASSGGGPKRTSKAAKRNSLTAMFGITRKKDKDKEHEKEKEKEKESDQLHSPPRPTPARVDTHHTTRTTHTFLTTHTSATAGSDDRASTNSGVMPGSPMELSPAIEPSAKTLARAAATRDQLEKRYAVVYSGIGGGEEPDVVSGSASASGSGGAEKQEVKPRAPNPLEVVRWRSAHLARRSAEFATAMRSAPAGIELEGEGEVWEREVERRIRDAPLSGGEHPVLFPGSGVPSAVHSPYSASAPLGDSLPEATSLSWLPYLEPVFAEERTFVEGGVGEVAMGAEAGGVGGMSGAVAMAGTVGMGAGGAGAGPGRRRPMTAWYILASFVDAYISSQTHKQEEEQNGDKSIEVFDTEQEESFAPTPRPTPPADILYAHTKVTSDVRAKAIVNAAYRATGTGATSDTNDGSGSRFGIIDRALRTRSRHGSVGMDSGTGSGGGRSRHGSIGPGVAGTTSEPTSPLYVAPPGVGPRGVGAGNTPSWLVPPRQTGDVRSGRSHSGSQIHSRMHSRSQSQARSISAGNGQLTSSGSIDWGNAAKHQVGEGKSMSPASSKLNLANFIMGGAAVLGLSMRKRAQGGHHGKDGVSGSENESVRVSSDMSPSDVDVRIGMGVGIGRGGVSDGEGGRVKRRKKTWREGERVPLSDGGGSGSGSKDWNMKRRSWRLSTTVLMPVEVQPEKERAVKERVDREKREREKEYARKRSVVEEGQDVLSMVDARLQSFAQLAADLNAVHHDGADIFGEMFVAIPPNVVSALAPELSEEEATTAQTPLAPTLPQHLRFNSLPSDPLGTFARKLEGEEELIAVDIVGRSKLNANLPLRAFDVLHTLDYKLKEISNRILDLRRVCDDAEQERKVVRELYENTAGNVETTYPECTQIERLLGSLVTEDMPWLPSWLPLWVRHLLEIFSNQIQFLVENGLRIYGYIYQLISLFMFFFALVLGATFIFARFVRSFWWVLAVAGISVIAYLMMRPPEGLAGLIESEAGVGL